MGEAIGQSLPMAIAAGISPIPIDRMKHWMSQNDAVIMSILCLIIGVKLIGQALGGWTA